MFKHSPVFRTGGDELAVVLRNEDFENREALTEKFEKAAADACAAAGNRWEEIHTSMGIAVFDPVRDQTVIDTMRRADKLMYTNKRMHKAGQNG